MDNAADTLLRDINDEIRVLRSLIGIIDTSEALDLTAVGLGVDPALIRLLAVLEGSRDVDKEEGTGLGNGILGSLAGVLVRGNRSSNDGSTGLGELSGNEGDALDVGVAIFAAESELGRELMADSVTEQQGHRASSLLVQGDLQGTSDRILAGVHIPSKEDGKALAGTRGVGLAEDLDNLGVGEPLGNMGAGAQTLAKLGTGDIKSLGACGDLVLGFILVVVRAVGDLLEGNDLDTELVLVLLDELLGVVGPVEVLALGVLTGTSVVTADDEVSRTVVLADNGMPESLTGTTHTHGEREKAKDGHTVGVTGEKGLIGTDTGEVVDITGLCEANNRVDQDIGLTSTSGANGQLTVSTVHRVPIDLSEACPRSGKYLESTWFGKRQLGSSRACRSGCAAPRE